jgi:hypothetical protein
MHLMFSVRSARLSRLDWGLVSVSSTPTVSRGLKLLQRRGKDRDRLLFGQDHVLVGLHPPGQQAGRQESKCCQVINVLFGTIQYCIVMFSASKTPALLSCIVKQES